MILLDQLLLLFIVFPGLLYFLIGFIYHYYRNKTYLNVTIESTAIGLILGYFIQADGIGLAEWTLTCIMIIFISGVLALKIRRRSSGFKLPESDEREDKWDYEVDIDKTDEKIENTEDKFSKYPLMKNNKFKPFKKTIPFTPPEEVKIYHYTIKKPFKLFKRISVRSDKSLQSKTTAIDDVNEKLKEKASNLGANAVINVVYKQGIFALFRGVRGYGRAVFIEDLENVEKTYPPGTNFLLILGFFWVMMGLLGFNDHNQFYLPLGITMVIYGVFTRLGYTNKTFFAMFLSIIILCVFQLLLYILKNGIHLYNFEFYFGAGFLAMLVISFVYSYKHRKNDPNLSWKDK